MKIQALLGSMVLAWLGLAPAWAQTPAASPVAPAASPATPAASPAVSSPAPPQGLNPDQVTDQQIRQLVDALVEIEPLLRKASADLSAARTDADRKQVEKQFEERATKIVQDKGLSTEQYRQLITLANNNPAFAQRVRRRLDEVKPPAASPSPTPVAPTTPAPTP